MTGPAVSVVFPVDAGGERRPMFRAKILDAIGRVRSDHQAESVDQLRQAIDQALNAGLPRGWWIVIRRDRET